MRRGNESLVGPLFVTRKTAAINKVNQHGIGGIAFVIKFIVVIITFYLTISWALDLPSFCPYPIQPLTISKSNSPPHLSSSQI